VPRTKSGATTPRATDEPRFTGRDDWETWWRNNGDPYFWGLKSSYNQPDDGAYRFMALTDFACNNFKWW